MDLHTLPKHHSIDAVKLFFWHSRVQKAWWEKTENLGYEELEEIRENL